MNPRDNGQPAPSGLDAIRREEREMARTLQRTREVCGRQVDDAERDAVRRVAEARKRGEATAAALMAQGLAAAQRRAEEIRESGRERARRLRATAERHLARWVRAALARALPAGQEEGTCSSR